MMREAHELSPCRTRCISTSRQLLYLLLVIVLLLPGAAFAKTYWHFTFKIYKTSDVSEAEWAWIKWKVEYIHFLYIALGSSAELETHLIISRNRNYLLINQFELLQKNIDIENKMLMNLIKSLNLKAK